MRIVLFPRHFAGPVAMDCISRIQLFRDYLHYHIKVFIVNFYFFIFFVKNCKKII
jgi:hypothetical protein